MKKLFVLTSSIITTFAAATISSCSNQSSSIAVTLYAGDVGTFGQTRSLYLTDFDAGTVLKDIANYTEPESDYEFLGWVDDNGNEIKPDTIINSSLFLRAHYSIPQADDFTTDPWSTVIYYANQGLDALCKAYSKTPDDFIGMKRILKINGLDHKVMVVGTNNEKYEKNGIGQIAALTFQFVTCISKQDNDGLATFYDGEQPIFDYWNSLLWNALNGTNVRWSDPTIRKSVAEMVADDEPLVSKNIKEVYRGVNSSTMVSPNYYPWHLDTRKTKFFEPTLANYFSDKGITDTGYGEELTDLFKSQEAMQRCMDEGDQYQYYALEGNIEDNILTTSKPPDYYKCLICTTVDGRGAVKYHLTSPVIDENNHNWFIEGEELRANFTYESSCCVVPCFCI